MAVALGAIGRPRGFEPHSRQLFTLLTVSEGMLDQEETF